MSALITTAHSKYSFDTVLSHNHEGNILPYIYEKTPIHKQHLLSLFTQLTMPHLLSKILILLMVPANVGQLNRFLKTEIPFLTKGPRPPKVTSLQLLSTNKLLLKILRSQHQPLVLILMIHHISLRLLMVATMLLTSLICLHLHPPKLAAPSLPMMKTVMMSLSSLTISQSFVCVFSSSWHQYLKIHLEKMQKDWNAPIYVFFQPTLTIEYIKRRKAHIFQCAASHC